MQTKLLGIICLAFIISSITHKKIAPDSWSGDYYKKNSCQQMQSALAIIEKIKFKGNESVLDIGCGDGKITACVAELVPYGNTHGIDISHSMIENAENSHKKIKNLSFEVIDATKFVSDQKFDYALSFFALHWITDQLQVLKNIKKVLKPGGKAIIIMSTSSVLSPAARFFSEIKSIPKWTEAAINGETRFKRLTVEEIDDLAIQAGFEKTKVDIVNTVTHFKSLDAFVSWSMGWIPHATKLSQEKALEFSNLFAKSLYKYDDLDISGPIDFKVSFLLAEIKNQK